MDYRYLDAFMCASQHLNFTKAAKELNITPAAVSRQVKLFEESVQTQLFIRSPQQVELTQAGKKIFNIAKSFQESTLEALNKEVNKEIRIGILSPCLEEWLPNLLKKFYKDSNINFSITTTGPAIITKMLEKGELDIGIYNKNIQTDLLTSRKIYSEQPVLISHSPINLKEISNHKWIIVEEKDYIINYAYKKRIKKSTSLIKVNSPQAQLKLVKSGLGIAIVSSSLVTKDSKLYQKPITHFSKEFIYLVTPNSKLLPAHIKRFIENIFKK
jgi:DNA-binding transcriptional LysR family regulator